MATQTNQPSELGLQESTRRSPRLAKTTRTSPTQRAWDCTDTLEPRPFWKARGLCLNVEDPDLFFGGDNKLPMAKDDVDEARSWCVRCPVARDCLIYAFQNAERYGIWAGLTVEERKRTREIAPSLEQALVYFDEGSLHARVVRL